MGRGAEHMRLVSERTELEWPYSVGSQQPRAALLLCHESGESSASSFPRRPPTLSPSPRHTEVCEGAAASEGTRRVEASLQRLAIQRTASASARPPRALRSLPSSQAQKRGTAR